MLEIICNPTAGTGHGEKVGQMIADALRQKGIAFHIQHTTRPGEATDMAVVAALSHAEAVYSVGGDGTALEVARGLVGTDTPLAIIPGGTGNDFIKTLGIPREPLAALEYILSHPALPTDVGEINGQIFLNEIGTGFDVEVLTYAAKAKKFCRGLMPYLYGVVQTLFRFSGIPLTCIANGTAPKQADAFVLSVANGGTIGGGIVISPEAKVDDALFDIVLIDKIKRANLLGRLVNLMKGKVLTFPETHHFRAKEISFSTPGMKVNVDGEIIPMDEVHARILPGALRIFR